MKILIACDMEGISGVVNWEQVTPGSPEYPRFRTLMTADVNAAIRGVFEAGADEVLVADGHNLGNNLLIEELDPRARLNSGTPAPFSMVQGIDSSVDGVLLVGYHAKAGTKDAILAHTWSDKCVANLWLNNKLVGETGLNAAVCACFGAPVAMISGDQTVCAEAMDLLGKIEIAAVKKTSGRMAAECLPPSVAQDKICEAACRAVSRLVVGENIKLFKPKIPINVRVEYRFPDMADRASLMPGVQRIDGCTIAFTCEDMTIAYRSFRASIYLARG